MNINGGPAGLLLLDTNVLMHLARADAMGKWLAQSYRLEERPERPLLCTVVEAEVRAFASYHKWGQRKLDVLGEIFSECVRVEIDRPMIIDRYVELYALARSTGHSIWQKNQNDLWLAATAKATEAVLLTTDADFDFLHPAYIRVERVPSAPCP